MAASLAPRRRLDELLVERALAPSNERAQALIAAGMVEVDGARAHGAAQPVRADAGLRLLGRDHPYVGRGGVKLAAALDHFAVEVCDRVALDAGASTGGFTDVLLRRGALRVYAVDVGYGQLDGGLRNDPRVEVMDRTNLRTLDAVPGPAPQITTLDVSFISLRLVVPAVIGLSAPGAEVVALFKPQFELAREAARRGGVVLDEEAALTAVREFARWARTEHGAVSRGEPFASPARGAKGNQEWFVHLVLPS